MSSPRFVRELGYPLYQHPDGPWRLPRVNDPLFMGMLGMHGTYEANMAMQHCDVLLAVGARFDDRVIGNPKHFFQEDRRRSSTSTWTRPPSPSA